MRAQFGKRLERAIETKLVVVRDRDDADFFGSDRRHVDLEPIAPVKFCAIGPRSDAVMAAEAEATRLEKGSIEAGSAANGRFISVGSDDPARFDGAAAEVSPVSVKTCDTRLPDEGSAGFGSAIEEQAMQSGAADSDAMAIREFGLNALAGSVKANAAKIERIG